MNGKINFEGLAAFLLGKSRVLVPSWFPGGRPRGLEFVCGNLRGEPGDSLSINLRTGAWADFADPSLRGGDLISLYAAKEGISNGDAAKRLARDYGFYDIMNPSAEVASPAKPPAAPVFIPCGNVSPPRLTHFRHGTQPTATYTYRALDGTALFFICRYDVNGEKEFLPFSLSKDGNWVNKSWPAPRPLYGLEGLGARPRDPVLIVEGEKAADAAKKICGEYYVVISWPNGVNSLQKVDWEPLRGRSKVLLWPDADNDSKYPIGHKRAGEVCDYIDQPGPAAMLKLSQRLLPLIPEVKILDVGGIERTGFDAADALAEGWDWKRFREWAVPRAKVVSETPTTTLEALPPEPPPKPQEPEVVNEHPIVAREARPLSTIALWQKLQIQQNMNGQPVCNIATVTQILANHSEYQSCFWYDEFHQNYFTNWRTGVTRQWTDSDALELTRQMQLHLQLMKMSDEMVSKGVRAFANNNVRNEPKEWMSSLTWDGTSRIESFFHRCAGCEDNEYTRAVSRNFWISMVARIFRPGCKVDSMVVLEGEQGIRKSTLLSTIGGPWYVEQQTPVSDKDFFLVLRGHLIVEIAELDAFTRADPETVKSTITRATDDFRKPYERVNEAVPRRSIFTGTTNKFTYLEDETGGRRFWPIRCGEIDIDTAAQEREQLFAEAVHRFHDNQVWYLMPAEATREQQAMRRRIDTWENAMVEFLCDRKEATLEDVIEKVLKLPLGQTDMKTERRIGKIFRVLGWHSHNLRRFGKQRTVWCAPGWAPNTFGDAVQVNLPLQH